MANQSIEKLFQEFPPITTEDWESLIERDLKGADYQKKLIWRTLEGIHLKPYYRAEDLTGKEYLDSLPGEAPFVRGGNKTSNEWKIQQSIVVKDPVETNEKILDVLNKGITSLNINCCSTEGNCAINDANTLSALLKDVHINCIDLNFACGCKATEVAKLLIQEIKQRGIDAKTVSGSLACDPLGHLNCSGSWYKNEEEDFVSLKSLLELTNSELPAFRALKIRGCQLHNSGASIIQELAYALSMANDYMARLTDAGMSIDAIAKNITLSLGVGANYFMEIAKLRAARFLWAKMVEAYNPQDEESKKVFIHCNTSGYNQTIYDAHNNILRATTEAMSAVIGGCNSLQIKPFDATYQSSDDFSERIARNIQVILKEEAYFDKIVDPSAGSYYIENITDALIEQVWNEFLEVEQKGGYLKALKQGYIQEQIEKTDAERAKRFAQRRDVLVGTNQYPHYNEFSSEKLNLEMKECKCCNTGTEVKPIKKNRLSIAFEDLRLATEQADVRPKVFMLTYGNLTMRKARATFSSNFFACAGYEVIDNLGFKTPEEGAEVAIKEGANIVVLCSSDDEYAEMAPKAFELLKGKAVVVVAGAPACADELKAKGIEHFIHMRTNVLESLQGFNKLLNIG